MKQLEENVSEKAGYPVQIHNDMKPSLSKLFYKMRNMWRAAKRTEERFFQNNEEWLSASVSFPIPAITLKTPKDKGGRLSTEFKSSSERTKRRKTEEVRSFTSEELA
jgi:hypothetical protein